MVDGDARDFGAGFLRGFFGGEAEASLFPRWPGRPATTAVADPAPSASGTSLAGGRGTRPDFRMGISGGGGINPVLMTPLRLGGHHQSITASSEGPKIWETSVATAFARGAHVVPGRRKGVQPVAIPELSGLRPNATQSEP